MDIKKLINDCQASQNKQELSALIALLKQSKPEVILEIGTWKGYSAELWIKVFNPYRFVSVELCSKEELEAKEIIDEHCTFFWRSNSNDRHTFLKVKDVIDPYKQGNKVDFLFIDGGHLYETVKKDFEWYGSLVKRKGGIIALHDIKVENNNTVEVPLFWNELKESGKYQMLEIHYPGGTGTGVIFL